MTETAAENRGTAYAGASADEWRNRQAEIVRRYAAGDNTAAIGRDFGISHQRVRQIAEQAGLPPRKPAPKVTPALILEAASANPEIQNLAGMAKHFGVTVGTIRRVMQANPDGFTRLRVGLAQRRSNEALADNEGKKQEMLDALRKLAIRLGHTPGIAALNAPDSGTPAHTTYVYHFGSLREAQRLAGLEPNAAGGAGHSPASRAKRSQVAAQEPLAQGSTEQ
jgi:hypothetical protein